MGFDVRRGLNRKTYLKKAGPAVEGGGEHKPDLTRWARCPQVNPQTRTFLLVLITDPAATGAGSPARKYGTFISADPRRPRRNLAPMAARSRDSIPANGPEAMAQPQSLHVVAGMGRWPCGRSSNIPNRPYTSAAVANYLHVPASSFVSGFLPAGLIRRSDWSVTFSEFYAWASSPHDHPRSWFHLRDMSAIPAPPSAPEIPRARQAFTRVRDNHRDLSHRAVPA